MYDFFPNQGYGKEILKHVNLPVYKTGEFDFYRCLAFNEGLYGKTVSELHAGNLREVNSNNRYASLFPGEKVSYWADSPSTARAEIKYHEKTNNLITFWSYDDATSLFPTTSDSSQLTIIDGRECGFADILRKHENGEALNSEDKIVIKKIIGCKPDCLAYPSQRAKDGVNYLFFEKGFSKLSIREVRLRLGNEKGKNTARIVCANTSDYSPTLEAYGLFFSKLAQVKMSDAYLKTDEYKVRTANCNKSVERFLRCMAEEHRSS